MGRNLPAVSVGVRVLLRFQNGVDKSRHESDADSRYHLQRHIAKYIYACTHYLSSAPPSAFSKRQIIMPSASYGAALLEYQTKRGVIHFVCLSVVFCRMGHQSMDIKPKNSKSKTTCPPYGMSSLETMCLIGLRATRGRKDISTSRKHIAHSAVRR